MRISRIWTIFQKEMIDTLRDRRTLVFMLIVPIVAIPLLIIGMSSLVVSQISKMEAAKTEIVVIGYENLPLELRDSLTQIGGTTFRKADSTRREDLIDSLRAGEFQALISIPASLGSDIAEEQTSEIRIFNDKAEIKSEVAVSRIQAALIAFKEKVVTARLGERSISDDLLTPFEVNVTNVASLEKMAGKEFGAFLPYLIIIMCFMGAMYPAIDLAAGEKERGTLETLLICPATREEIVLGKYLVVVVTGVVTALLSLSSLTLSMSYLVDASVQGVEHLTAIKFNLSTAAFMTLTMLPLAGMFAGVLISVSVFARSFKEAQSYVTVLNMAIVLPAFVSMLPGVETNYLTVFIPVVNISLILRDAMSGPIQWHFAFLALVGNLLFAILALMFAIKWFKRESIIFRM